MGGIITVPLGSPQSGCFNGRLGLREKTDKETVNLTPCKVRKRKLLSWNVRTMHFGLSDDLHEVDDSRKTAIINIAALQETRLSSNGRLREQDYTFFWQGKEPVELASKNTAYILSLRLSTPSGQVNILRIYAPTLCSSDVAKDEFYKELETAIREIPASEHLYLLGDLNSWPHSISQLNENGHNCC